MTIRELRNLIRLKHLPDQWWIAIDNEVYEEKIRLIDLEMRQSRLKHKKIHILNADITYSDRDWTQVDFSGLHLTSKPKLCNASKPRLSSPMLLDSISCKNGRGSISPIPTPPTTPLAKDEHSRILAQKESELKALERELREREEYVKKSEDALIERSYLHEVKEAELEQLSENVYD